MNAAMREDMIESAITILRNGIKDRRLALSLSQREVARRADLAQSAVARLENGSVVPRLDTFLRVAVVLGLDCLDLRFEE